MGIKTAITLEELSAFLPCSVLTPTEYGVSDSVYLTDIGVLKLFESASTAAIMEERNLLHNLSKLPVAKHSSDLFHLHNKPCVMYEKIPGAPLEKADYAHIIKIAEFMQRFHQSTKGTSSSNPKLFERNRLQSLIEQTAYAPLQLIFDSIDLGLSNDGVIHGDLFLDNALFENGELSGVFDFIEACEGDFLFDLAVVAIAWCMDAEEAYSKVTLLLKHYNNDVCLEAFVPYMRYALLYYATTRYLGNRDYQTLLDKMPLIDALEGPL